MPSLNTVTSFSLSIGLGLNFLMRDLGLLICRNQSAEDEEALTLQFQCVEWAVQF